MHLHFSIWLGCRYWRSDRHSRLVSFMSVISVTSLALSVCVLIVVLSVMNGFRSHMQSHILSQVPHLRVMSMGEAGVMEPSSLGVGVEVSQQSGVLNYAHHMVFASLLGVSRADLQTLSPTHAKQLMREGFGQFPFRLWLSAPLAQRLGVEVGDKVSVLIPSPSGLQKVRYKNFRVGGVLTGIRTYSPESGVVWMTHTDAKVFFHASPLNKTWWWRLNDPFQAEKIAQAWRERLPTGWQVVSWQEQYHELFSAMAMERHMMSLLLSLFVILAIFNLGCAMMITITQKRSAIAILRTLGALPRDILRIFLIQGFLSGLFGTLIGAFLGIVVSTYITSWSNALQHLLGVEWFSGDIYWVNYLPSQWHWQDVGMVVGFALGAVALSILYPAYRASQVMPAQALRDE